MTLATVKGALRDTEGLIVILADGSRKNPEEATDEGYEVAVGPLIVAFGNVYGACVV